MDASSHSRINRRHLLAGVAAGGALFAVTGCVAAPAFKLATLEVYDRDTGQVLPTYSHHGRTWVPGRPGARYALRLRNHGDSRLLVVLSVDGINVISGQTADWGQTGYVLDAGRSYDINGWRKSDTAVAAFEFASIERSYAARTGRPDHVGVIGMAVFRERPLAPPSPPPAPPVAMAPAAPAAVGSARENAADSAAGAGAERQASRLGTGHGQREWSVSRRTTFERAASVPDQVVQLDYDSLDRLAAAGIVPVPRPLPPGRPSPFPGSPMAYVPDPPRW
jgi:hypothetical protein